MSEGIHLPGEEWRPVPGWEGLYEVSDHGRVRSLPRVTVDCTGRSRPFPGKLLRHRPANPYPRVNLMQGRDRFAELRIHVLVLTAFMGPRPAGMQGCHYDDNPLNNHLSNLRWDTISGNQRDRIRLGNHNHAFKTRCPRGHLLQEPNLIHSQLRLGCRSCRSCRTGLAYARRRQVRSETVVRQVADAKYRLLIPEDAECRERELRARREAQR